jgi:hypothetical protein
VYSEWIHWMIHVPGVMELDRTKFVIVLRTAHNLKHVCVWSFPFNTFRPQLTIESEIINNWWLLVTNAAISATLDIQLEWWKWIDTTVLSVCASWRIKTDSMLLAVRFKWDFLKKNWGRVSLCNLVWPGIS